MSSLREEVKIYTTLGELRGHLYVGDDCLPMLEISPLTHSPYWGKYSPATFPAAWTLQQAELGDVGILFESWRTISELQFEIAQAQRETEDDAKEGERNRETDNRIEEE